MNSLIQRRLLPAAATALARTLRIRWTGEPLPERAVLAFWHGKMFAGWYAVSDRRPLALVSNSKDGGILAGVLTAWKYKLVRGSSGKQGKEALAAAIDIMKAGERELLVITPDGPKGPYHAIKRGVCIAAKELTLPLFFLRITYHAPISFRKSWDQFEVPKPYSRVTISVERVDISGMPEDPEQQREWLKQLSLKYA